MLCALAMLGMYACTAANLDLCMEGHPHRGQLIVEYDWSGLDEHPDSMVVMALRPIFRDKVSSRWASDVNAGRGENRRYGTFIASATGEDDIYHSPLDEALARDLIYLTAGEWEISSYTSNPTTVEATKDYTVDVQDDGGELFYKLDPFDELPEEYSYWRDRNSYSTWVDLPQKHSVCLARGTLVVDEHADTKKDYKVVLRPKNVAQKINLSFEAKAEPGINVDRIVCAISGIPTAININTLALDIDVTHQAIFETNVSTSSNGNITAQQTLYALGLVRSATSAKLQGPGILNVSVFVNYEDDNGKRRERRLDATVNLFRLLSETPSVKYDDMGRVVQTTSQLNLNVRSTLLISKDKLSNIGEVIDPWVDDTEIDVEN